MSDIAILSGHYEAVSELSTKLNEAILILKKKALNADKQESTVMRARDWSEADEARETLREFLNELIKAIDKRSPAEAIIPHSIIDVFQKLRRNDSHFDRGLKNLHHRFAHYQELTQKDFELLDKVLLVVDSDVEAVFRKLWRRR
jgi:6-phosphogluconate dehydrogenase (decarboxylating)